MNIVWPTSDVNQQIKDIRTAIGENITINTKVVGSGCYVCSLNPVTNTSTDPYCPVCHGAYWLNTISGVTVLAHVRWITAEMPTILPGGKIPDGDCIATVELVSGIQYIIENSESFTIDSKRLTLKNYKLRGKPTPNRITITLLEEIT